MSFIKQIKWIWIKFQLSIGNSLYSLPLYSFSYYENENYIECKYGFEDQNEVWLFANLNGIKAILLGIDPLEIGKVIRINSIFDFGKIRRFLK